MKEINRFCIFKNKKRRKFMENYVVTNKDFNYKIRELKRRRGRTVSEEHPRKLIHSYGNIINELELTGYWTGEMGKVFDVIHSIIIQKYWTESLGSIPFIKNKHNLTNLTNKYYEKMSKDENFIDFKINYYQLKTTRIFDKYSKITFTNILKEIQKTKFKFNNFRCRCANNEITKDNERHISPAIQNININEPNSLIESFKVTSIEHGHSQSIKIPLYHIKFTSFGRCILINSLLLSVDWIPLKVYHLSTNAQFLYKRYIVHRKQEKEFEVSYIELQSFLDISGSLKTNAGNIMSALEELKQIDVVSKYEEIGKKAFQKFYKITRSKKDHF